MVVAAAALDRLGLLDRAAEILRPSRHAPAGGPGRHRRRVPGRRRGDPRRLVAIDDAGARVAVTAERAFLARLGGGCDLPVGALARSAAGEVALGSTGMLASADGRVMLRSSRTGPTARSRPDARVGRWPTSCSDRRRARPRSATRGSEP